MRRAWGSQVALHWHHRFQLLHTIGLAVVDLLAGQGGRAAAWHPRSLRLVLRVKGHCRGLLVKGLVRRGMLLWSPIEGRLLALWFFAENDLRMVQVESHVIFSMSLVKVVAKRATAIVIINALHKRAH